MKKRISRIVALLLALAMVFTMTACGAKKEEAAAPAAAPAATEEKKEEAAAPAAEEEAAAPEEQAAETTADGEPVYGGEFGIGKAMGPAGLCDLYTAGFANQFNFPAIEQFGRWNFDTQEYDPFLFESWEHDYDANTFTLHLQPGVTFQCGEPFSAEGLKWEFEFFIENRGGATLGNPTEIEVVDDLTLVLHYDAPSFGWEGQISTVGAYCPKCYKENDENWAQNNICGTGAFIFDKYVPDDGVYFVKNENYWQEGLPYLDKYNVRIITDWAALEAAFIAGENNYYNVAEASTCKEMIALGYESVAKNVPENFMQFLVMVNNTDPEDPFAKVEVRDAVLNYAVDWVGITMSRDDGRGLCTYQGQIASEGGWGWLDNCWIDEDMYDQEKAKQMIADAGYPDGFKTDIWTQGAYVAMATQMQSELKKIGIEAEVHTDATAGQYFDPTLKGIHMGAWVNATDSAQHLTETFYPTSYTIIDYPENYVAAVDKAVASLTKEERQEAQKEAFSILYDEMKVARAYFSQGNFTVVSEGAHNVGAEYKTYFHEAIWWDNK